MLINLQETGSFDRSGRPCTSHSCDNISAVEEEHEELSCRVADFTAKSTPEVGRV